MEWIVTFNYFLHHFPLMYLGEVITGDVIEAVEMPFGRQMVHLKLRTLSINRKMESCPMWDGGCVKPRVCKCVHGQACAYTGY